jgi:hypothetical protein
VTRHNEIFSILDQGSQTLGPLTDLILIIKCAPRINSFFVTGQITSGSHVYRRSTSRTLPWGWNYLGSSRLKVNCSVTDLCCLFVETKDWSGANNCSMQLVKVNVSLCLTKH